MLGILCHDHSCDCMFENSKVDALSTTTVLNDKYCHGLSSIQTQGSCCIECDTSDGQVRNSADVLLMCAWKSDQPFKGWAVYCHTPRESPNTGKIDIP